MLKSIRLIVTLYETLFFQSFSILSAAGDGFSEQVKDLD